MNIDSILKKESITIIEQLDTLRVNSIAQDISSKLCLAFPEHNLNKSDLFVSISRINMYIADMGTDSSGAKYYYKNNSIYFNKNIEFEKLPTVAIHECIHFIQEVRDDNNNILCMGLYNFSSGLGINEATVQLMASEANMHPLVQEKYFNISLNTISPDFYPLECALVKQISYFTGTYPLYHSTLNCNDVFKNTLIAKSDKKTYYTIIKNLDNLLKLEDELAYFSSELLYEEKINAKKILNSLIEKKKLSIILLFFRTQNLIIKKLFTNEFNNIRNLNDIKEIKEKFYNFKDLIGTAENYTFYNNFYIEMMDALERKRDYIENYGEINLFEKTDNILMFIDNTKNILSFISSLFKKVKRLISSNKENVNDL